MRGKLSAKFLPNGVVEAIDRYNNPTFALKREREDYPGLSIEYGRMTRVQFLKLAGVGQCCVAYNMKMMSVVATRRGLSELKLPVGGNMGTPTSAHEKWLLQSTMGLAVKGSHKQGRPGLNQGTCVCCLL